VTEPLALRDMGSFHIGGRRIEVRGQPIRQVLFTPGGVPAKVDPNGVYQVTTSPADSSFDPDPVPENYGAWTYVFDRGRFVVTQEDEQACTWGYGTYVVEGDRVVWSFTDDRRPTMMQSHSTGRTTGARSAMPGLFAGSAADRGKARQ
jgi:hypothetical protein